MRHRLQHSGAVIAAISRGLLLYAGVLFLGACANNSGNDSEYVGEIISTVDGEAAYAEYCAGCHETGMLGAPVAGAAEDWAGRSKLWDAVLFDHAITGYLEMPARGGRTELPDEVVKAAAEYMLRLTFPDMPHDCNPPYCGDHVSESE